MESLHCANCQSLQRRVHDLQAENERLRRQLDEATRAGKRQAAPFAKGQPKPNPRKPGRKSGKDYGTKAHRQPPTPEQIYSLARRRRAVEHFRQGFPPRPRAIIQKPPPLPASSACLKA